MATINVALDALEARCGFPKWRTRQIARRLQEVMILPSGAPRRAPQIDEDGFVDLLIAVATDIHIHEAPAMVQAYRALTPGGLHVTHDTPEGVSRCARDELAIFVELARGSIDEQRDVVRTQFEFVSSWPELAIHTPHGTVNRFREPGAAAGNWGARGHRRSTVVNGAALVDAVRDIFKGKSQ